MPSTMKDPLREATNAGGDCGQSALIVMHDMETGPGE